MKKELGIKPYLFPMPVLMIATYGSDGAVDVMNMAWGGICAENMVSLNIGEGHKTAENIKQRGAFTLSVADIPHIEAADFFGIASGNKMADKFERTGLTAVKSEKVDAPVVEEFPLTLECKVVEAKREVYGFHVIGEIAGVLADEKVLDEKGRVDPTRLNAFVFDQFQNGYYAIGQKVHWRPPDEIEITRPMCRRRARRRYFLPAAGAKAARPGAAICPVHAPARAPRQGAARGGAFPLGRFVL